MVNLSLVLLILLLILKHFFQYYLPLNYYLNQINSFIIIYLIHNFLIHFLVFNFRLLIIYIDFHFNSQILFLFQINFPLILIIFALCYHISFN